jgi:uncharacterized protein Yka (UPF0111/DUF47 family)
MAKLKPKEKAYYAHFSTAAHATAEAADLLGQVLHGSAGRSATAGGLASLAEVADTEYRSVLTALRASFVTPFDRAEIQALSRALARAVRRMETAGALVHLLDPPELPKELPVLADLIGQVAGSTEETIGKLRKLKGIKHHHEQVCQIAAEAEFHRRLLLVRLTSGEIDPLDAIEFHALSDDLAATVDRLVDVAEIVETVLITEG